MHWLYGRLNEQPLGGRNAIGLRSRLEVSTSGFYTFIGLKGRQEKNSILLSGPESEKFITTIYKLLCLEYFQKKITMNVQ